MKLAAVDIHCVVPNQSRTSYFKVMWHKCLRIAENVVVHLDNSSSFHELGAADRYLTEMLLSILQAAAEAMERQLLENVVDSRVNTWFSAIVRSVCRPGSARWEIVAPSGAS